MFCCFCLFVSCVSIGKIEVEPEQIEYKEISISEFMKMGKDLSSLYSDGNIGYKLTDVYIVDISADNSIFYLNKDNSYSHELGVSVQDYFNSLLNNSKEKAKLWMETINVALNEDNKHRYNGHFTFYLYVTRAMWNVWNGFIPSTQCVYNIEGIPSLEQIEADKEAEESERIEKEEAEKKAKAEELRKIDEKGKSLAKGYIYHGIEEAGRNARLFTGGAFENGHAYYIANFAPNKYSPSNRGSIMTLITTSPSVYVNYESQKVKGEVLEKASFFGEYLPVAVVIALPSNSSTPVILGLVE